MSMSSSGQVPQALLDSVVQDLWMRSDVYEKPLLRVKLLFKEFSFGEIEQDNAFPDEESRNKKWRMQFSEKDKQKRVRGKMSKGQPKSRPRPEPKRPKTSRPLTIW